MFFGGGGSLHVMYETSQPKELSVFVINEFWTFCNCFIFVLGEAARDQKRFRVEVFCDQQIRITSRPADPVQRHQAS